MKSLVLLVSCALVLGGLTPVSRAGEGDGGKADEWRQLRKEKAGLEKSLREVGKRLDLHKDAELVELKAAIGEAQKAYQAKMEEKIKADPEGATILSRIDELETKMKSMRGGKEGNRKEGRGDKGGKGGKKDRQNRDDGDDPVMME
jgi:hypothetical protein